MTAKTTDDVEFLCAFIADLIATRGACGCTIRIFADARRQATGREGPAWLAGFLDLIEADNRARFAEHGQCLTVGDIAMRALLTMAAMQSGEPLGDDDDEQWKSGDPGD